MFTGLISYNCSFTNWENLTILFDNTSANCYSSVLSPNNTGDKEIVNVTCVNIKNNAGRDWSFKIRRKSIWNETFLNETFIVTLKPLLLNISTNISINVDLNLTSASVFIWNCKDISDPRYLVFRCNDSDTSNNTLPENCTDTCYDLEPGSDYNLSLVLLPIPIADKKYDKNNTFEGDSLPKPYRTGESKRVCMIII
jgi:hypothetical protein